MKVTILHDDVPPNARPDELDVLVQAEAILAALAELGHAGDRLPLGLDLAAAEKKLRQTRPDVVFNIVESVAGTGRLIHLAPALLDQLNIPYAGAGTEAMFITSDKTLAKRCLAAAGIPTPAWFALAGVGRSPFPGPGRYIIKSVWEEASLGIDDNSVVAVDSTGQLEAEIARRAPQMGGEAFAEAYVAGREFNLAVLAGPDGPEVMPPAEIHFVGYAPDRPRLVGYKAKWDEGSYEYHHTPRSFDFSPTDAALLGELRRLALACWEAFELHGYARVDFRVDEHGRPWVLEINANPCLSPDAGFAAATARRGLTYAEVIARVLADPVRRGS